MLSRQSREYMQAFAQPRIANLAARCIDKDMAEWSRSIHLQVAALGVKTRGVPPESVRDLPPAKVPVWTKLKRFLNSGALDIADVAAKGQASPGKKATKHEPVSESEDCIRFAKGLCKTPKCRYRHRVDMGADGHAVEVGDKRGRATTATAQPAKKQKGAKVPATAEAKAANAA